ncbi:hypothetical protein CDAR_482431 [Caerostris darwini]|uniref:Uncharacterized protein n=1 Tax=Caerostris darwini TaxID=1538125 RepID=A0AAV4TJJ7_9ARAC|nr:hypothetical protein CDAR_482431 [Caerostris darwini]
MWTVRSLNVNIISISLIHFDLRVAVFGDKTRLVATFEMLKHIEGNLSETGLDDIKTTSGCQASRRRILLHQRSVRKRPRLYLRTGLPFTCLQIKSTI